MVVSVPVIDVIAEVLTGGHDVDDVTLIVVNEHDIITYTVHGDLL
jgi:hypothetical protein